MTKTPQPSNLRDNMFGAALMAGSMAAFTLNDAFMKSLADDWPFFQTLFLRALATVVVLFVATAWRGFGWSGFTARDWRMVAVRSIAEVAAAYFFLSALFNMPIANITAIIQALPLTITLGAALFLGERVGWRRYIAIGIGGIGVAIIVRPGADGFDTYAIYGLLAVVCVTVRDLSARRLGPGVPTLTVSFLTALSILLFAGLGAATVEWAPMTATSLAKVLGATFFVIGGYIFSIQVMRQGDIAFVAPFRYTSLLWALGLGWFVFGDWPDVVTLIGAMIVVSTGLFTIYRESRVARR